MIACPTMLTKDVRRWRFAPCLGLLLTSVALGCSSSDSENPDSTSSADDEADASSNDTDGDTTDEDSTSDGEGGANSDGDDDPTNPDDDSQQGGSQSNNDGGDSSSDDDPANPDDPDNTDDPSSSTDDDPANSDGGTDDPNMDGGGDQASQPDDDAGNNPDDGNSQTTPDPLGREPLVTPDGPEGGICFEPEELRLDDWSQACVPPTEVDVACEITATATGDGGTSSTTIGLDDRGHPIWTPLAPPYPADDWIGGRQLTVRTDDWETVLHEVVNVDGCVVRRDETFVTTTGSISIQNSPEGSFCTYTERSDSRVTQYERNADCSCEQQAAYYETLFDEDGNPTAQFADDSSGDRVWSYYGYEDGRLVAVRDASDNVKISYAYDDTGRVVEACGTNIQQLNDTESVDLGCITTEYGDDGSVTTRYPQGEDRPATLSHVTFTDDGLPLVTTLSTEGEDSPTQTTVVERNADGWVLSYTTTSASAVNAHEYTYTDAGQLASIDYSRDGELQRSHTFTYDDLGRLVSRAEVRNDLDDADCTVELSYPSDDCKLTLQPNDFTQDPQFNAPRIYGCE